jgi:hypothetical protein
MEKEGKRERERREREEEGRGGFEKLDQENEKGVTAGGWGERVEEGGEREEMRSKI